MSRQTTSTPSRATSASGSRSAARRGAPGAPLVIVESPSKVSTISRILGSDFTVRASYGHIADIAARTDAVDVADGFAAPYHLTKKGAEVVRGLSIDLVGASELILATDDDREGEMIAHLLVEFLRPAVPVSRIVFGSITEPEVLAALENRRSIDPRLVEAARSRRILDHLWGFRMSPVLWEKVRGGLSAGRVQNPALRLVVDREWERRAFVPAVYCGVEARLALEPEVVATLVSLDGVAVASSKDFDDAGRITGDARRLDPDEAAALVAALEGDDLTVESVKREKYTRRPRRPYVTSDLLSDIVNRLKVGSARAQALVNQLYEKGHVTYPRTDNPALSREATAAARAVAVELFGADSVPAKPNRWFAKKGAQQAHEAIRPTRMSARSIRGLTPAHAAVYEMIWRRTIASQMVDATGTTTSVVFVAEVGGRTARFRAAGTTIEVPGHRLVFSHPDDDVPTPLASVSEGDTVAIASCGVGEHTTRPPARYTESSLITALEEHGIGRPSTYASTMEALRREYMWSRRGDRALLPTITGIAVHGFLALCFPEYVDFEVTSRMEDRLEKVATGDESLEHLLSGFLLEGDGDWPALEPAIARVRAEHDPADRPVVVLGEHPVTGESIILRAGKTFGRRAKGAKWGSGAPYLKCGERNIPVSDRIDFAAFSLEQAVALVDVPREGRDLGAHEGESVLLKVGRFGPWVEHRGVRASVSVDEVASMDLAGALDRVDKRKSALARRVQS
ncbi:MAG: topoisomerase 1 [Actinomycetota bacterium]|jgi:DNA topoisomerase-1